MKRLFFSMFAALIAFGLSVVGAHAEYTSDIMYNFGTSVWKHTGPVVRNLNREPREMDTAVLIEDDDEATETRRETRQPAVKQRGSSRKAHRASARRTVPAVSGGRFVRRTGRPLGRSATMPSLGGGQMGGLASYYWKPQRVASGGWFNPNGMTAAHKTLPFGTRVRVTHARTGRSVDVTINDRGPYVRGRVIDLSSAAAGALGMKSAGLARVQIDVLGR